MAERPPRPPPNPSEPGTGPIELHTADLELEPAPPSGAGLPGWVKAAAVVAALGVAVGAALTYRSYHRRKVLRDGLARAGVALRADTQAGYLAAARLLEPLSQLDPVEAGAMRAFALAMLFADYRDAKAADEAEALLVEPDRAAEVPVHAQLAAAALALGRQEAGNATAHAARAASATGLALQARTALLAGNLGAAAEPLARAVESDPTLPMALALRGDVFRRSGNAAEARRSYLEALAASPLHARAAFGLGKLALSGRSDAAEARDALSRLVAAPDAAPPNERARAALHLAALQARAGDRAGAAATVERAGLAPAARAWLEKAVAEEELARGPYRAVGGAPPALQSAADDDPWVAPPPAPPRAEPVKVPKTEKAKAAKKKVAKKAKAKKPSKAKKTPKPKKPAAGQKAPPPKKPAEAPAP